MKAHFNSYPKIWGLTSTDRNIDHRRVPNLRTYFKRMGWQLKLTQDLVTCNVPSGRPHIMIVSDRKSHDGTPMIIHNIGGGTQEENKLFAYELTGHYRMKIAQSQPEPSH